jgi:hypothetical protein
VYSTRCIKVRQITVTISRIPAAGGDGLKSAIVLSDKQHVICADSAGHCFLYNVLGAKLVKELGKVDVKEEVDVRNKQEFIPNWFSADVKTGVSDLVCPGRVLHFGILISKFYATQCCSFDIF